MTHTRITDPEHGEVYIGQDGLARLADSTRVPELDGPAARTLDRGEVLRVLEAAHRFDRRMQCATENTMAANRLDARCNAYAQIADELGFTDAEWDAARGEVGR